MLKLPVMVQKGTKRFIIGNRLEELPLLAEKVEALAAAWELKIPLVMNLNLVLEEVISNIINYGFPDHGLHKIRVSITGTGDRITLTVRDGGVPFDPTTAVPPDITLPAGERPIGGLGILLVSQLMDDVRYARIKGQNILTLTKYTGYEHNE